MKGFINFLCFLVGMIGIIGGGPIGCYLSSLLKDVKIFEEHNEIGKPVQCTGLVTGELGNVVKIKKEFVVNEVSDFRIRGGKEEVEFKLKKNYVLDREKFDRYLMERALDNGTEVLLNHKYETYKDGFLRFKNKKIKCDVLVGADGVFSKVGYDFFGKKKYVRGVQARVRGKFDNVVDVEIGKGFSWIVPENEEIARVGYFGESNVLKGKKILEWQSGFVPLYDKNYRTSNENVYLVGDAAGMVKASTYGGLVTGLIGTRELSNVLGRGNYERAWRKKIGKDLDRALLVRKMLDRFNEKDYEELLRLCKGKKVKNILESYDRDHLSRFFWKMVINEPRFLKFFFKVF